MIHPQQVHSVSPASDAETASTATSPITNSATVKGKILCIIETIGLGGGAEQLLISLIPALKKRGYLVDLVALYPWKEDIGYQLEKEGVRVHRFNIRHIWNIPLALFRMRKVLKHQKYDFFWGHLYFGNLIAMLSRLLSPFTKTVVTHQSPGFPKSFRWKWSGFIQWAAAFIFNPKMIAVSKETARQHQDFFGREVGVVYSGVPTDSWEFQCAEEKALEVRSEFGVARDDFLIVIPTRYTVFKGHLFLFEALKILKQKHQFSPRVVGAGVGEHLKVLKDWVAQNPEHAIELKPSLPHDGILRLMKAADLVVIPSLKEPFGIVAAEAMYLKKCVIVSRVEGLAEIVSDTDSAYFVTPGSAEELSEAIWKLSQDSFLRKGYEKRAFDRISSSFSIRKSAENWDEVFARALQK